MRLADSNLSVFGIVVQSAVLDVSLENLNYFSKVLLCTDCDDPIRRRPIGAFWCEHSEHCHSDRSS
jgi:hypothetical protein